VLRSAAAGELHATAVLSAFVNYPPSYPRRYPCCTPRWHRLYQNALMDLDSSSGGFDVMLNMVCNNAGHTKTRRCLHPQGLERKTLCCSAHHHSGYHSGVIRALHARSARNGCSTDAHVHMAVSTQQCTSWSTTAAAISEQDPFSRLSWLRSSVSNASTSLRD
jgi:hypothetical protein